MTDPTSVETPDSPTQNDLAGLFKQFRAPEQQPEQPSEPVQEAEPEVQPPAEPEQPVETETQEFEAEPEAAPEVEPEAADVQPIIPPPAGMTQAQVDAFGSLPPEMQQFVAGQDAHRTADYQRRSTELASQRRETEALRSQLLERLNTQIGTLEQQNASRPVPPDPQLRDTDYEEYERQRDAYILDVHRRDERDRELAKAKEERDAETQRVRQDFLAEQSALLPSMIPEVGDPAKAAQIQKDVAEFALHEGYTPVQMSNFRAVDIKHLYQSMCWERAKKAAGGTGGTSKPKAPKAQRPGTASPTLTGGQKQYAAARKAFDQNPDRNSLAGLFAATRAERS